MGIINTGLFPEDLRLGIRKWFGDEYQNYSQIYSRIFEVLSDDKAYVENALLSGLGLTQRKAQGSSVTYDNGKQGYVPRFDHFTMALGFQITFEMFRDGIALKNAERFSKGLKRASMLSDEIVSHLVLSRAFNSSYTMTNGDGKELCSTSHPIIGGTVSNKPATDVDLSEAALEQAVIDISLFKDDRNTQIFIMPKDLIVHTSGQFLAHRILKSQRRVDTPNNDNNALLDMGSIQSVISSPFIVDQDSWFLTTNCPDGLQFYDRMPAEIDNDNDFDTGSGKFKLLRRLSVGWTDFRGIYGSQGA